MLPPVLLVMLGGALGSGGRYLAGQAALRALGPGFPWGTWLVNLGGSFLMGLVIGLVTRTADGPAEAWRLFLAVGVLGGFTTFSAFSLELQLMLARGEPAVALAYALSSVAGGVAMLAIGLALARIPGPAL